MQKIRKAVIPAAGYGTRFLPVTKTVPKEMLPVLDKPLIHHIVQDLTDAGIEQVIFVVSSYKKAIEDYFGRFFELEYQLEKNGKTEALRIMKEPEGMAEFVFVRQPEMNGNGGAILCAKNIIGDEPFIVSWADDIIRAENSEPKQLVEAYKKYGTTILGGIRTTDPEDTNKYGYAGGEEIEDGIIKVSEFIEKPGPDNAPSDLAIVSSFVFNSDIFPALEKAQKEIGNNRELVYVDGVNTLLKEGKDAHAIEVKGGKHYDTGNIMEFLKTNIEFALMRDEIKDEFKDYLKSLDI